jgi:hypothetical protein
MFKPPWSSILDLRAVGDVHMHKFTLYVCVTYIMIKYLHRDLWIGVLYIGIYVIFVVVLICIRTASFSMRRCAS